MSNARAAAGRPALNRDEERGGETSALRASSSEHFEQAIRVVCHDAVYARADEASHARLVVHRPCVHQEVAAVRGLDEAAREDGHAHAVFGHLERLHRGAV